MKVIAKGTKEINDNATDNEKSKTTATNRYQAPQEIEEEIETEAKPHDKKLTEHHAPMEDAVEEKSNNSSKYDVEGMDALAVKRFLNDFIATEKGLDVKEKKN